MRVKPRPHRGAGEPQWEFHHAALHLARDLLLEHEIQRGPAVAGVQQLAVERTPALAGHPFLTATGIIPALVQPAQRLVMRGQRLLVGEIFHAVKAAGLHPVDRATRHPSAFIVAAGELTVGTHAHTVWRTETGSHHGELLAVLVDLQQRPGVRRHMAVAAAAAEAAAATAHWAGLDGIEVACLIRVQIEHEFMEPLRAGDVVIKTLVMIGGTVVVQVMIPRHLITAGGVDHVVHNLEAERFKAATGKARPFQVLKVFILQPFHNPHVAIPGGQRSAVSVTEEIQAAKTHAAVPGIAFRCRDHIRGVGAIGCLAGIHHALRHHQLRPSVFAYFAKFRLHRRLDQRGKLAVSRFGAAPDANLECAGSRAFGQLGDDAFVFLHLQRDPLGRIHQRHLRHRITGYQNGYAILHTALGILHLTYQRGHCRVQRAVL